MKKSKKSIDWVNTLFLTLTPVAAIILTIMHIKIEKFNPIYIILLVFFYFLTGMSITAGYHRLFSHRTYQSKNWIKLLYLIFGASAFQNSALKWSTDHRRHHHEVDTQNDPYNINKGGFYAHIGWIFFKEDSNLKNNWPKDLINDPLIRWQHNYYIPIGILSGFILPLIIGFFLGSPLGGIGILGILKIVMVHHSTFFINSLCHMIGARPFTDANTARDNTFLALFTFGEGYHNFHHKFQADFRNGIRWYHYDPTKWLILLLAKSKQAYNLNKVPELTILKAKLQMQQKYALQKLAGKSSNTFAIRIEKLHQRLVETQKQMGHLKEEYYIMKKQKKKESMEAFENLKANIKLTQIEFKMLMAQWGIVTQIQ